MAARLWHKAPFLRLLLALTTGIVLQRHLQLPLLPLLIGAAASFVFVGLYSFTGIRKKFKLSEANGAAVLLLFGCTGSLLVWLNDVRNNPDWIGHRYKPGAFLCVKLEEPLVEKTASYKALASVVAVIDDSLAKAEKGTLILYFKKDSSLSALQYGSRIVLNKPLQEIKNAGNPGSFDYKTYSLFHGITHQVFSLTKNDYTVLPGVEADPFQTFLFKTRAWVVDLLRRCIPGEKEQGLAEALLIGFKDDLDKNLVQAYSNTGVVHIIAISGLHLGLIYVLLVWLTKPLKRNRKLLWLRLLLIVGSLWLFSLLAGAGPSVLRSAVMFTAIAIGELVARRTNIINTLSFSAVMLLCYNPFWLWDVGFQLSYTAVLSIVLFFQPVYNWLTPQNKILDFFWKLTAVTIAAQLLTTPISVYHFHQMPLLFLVTNFVAVPLSSLVLMGEILLCALAFLPPVAAFIGRLLHHFIYWMNSYIEGLDSTSFAVWNGLSISLLQTVLLLVFVAAFCYWLMEKERRLAWMAFASFGLFMALRGVSFAEAAQQQKLVVYNVPRHTAIDVMAGRDYVFIGDSALLFDEFTRNFHLQPSRILHRISPLPADASLRSFTVGGKQVVVMDESLPLVTAEPKKLVDVLVLSKNPRLFISHLQKAFVVKQVVIDGSVPVWKATRWKHDCDSLRIPCYNVVEDGAFVMNW